MSEPQQTMMYLEGLLYVEGKSDSYRLTKLCTELDTLREEKKVLSKKLIVTEGAKIPSNSKAIRNSLSSSLRHERFKLVVWIIDGDEGYPLHTIRQRLTERVERFVSTTGFEEGTLKLEISQEALNEYQENTLIEAELTFKTNARITSWRIHVGYYVLQGQTASLESCPEKSVPIVDFESALLHCAKDTQRKDIIHHLGKTLKEQYPPYGGFSSPGQLSKALFWCFHLITPDEKNHARTSIKDTAIELFDLNKSLVATNPLVKLLRDIESLGYSLGVFSSSE
jgi:hypothetical protein